jgi:ADP-ribose pyrophosphatase YjhB (NUDIX family)
VTEQHPTVTTIATGVARIRWPESLQEQGFTTAVGVVSQVVKEALAEHGRVEALVDPDDEVGQRIATWSGLLREGVMRGGHVVDGVHADRVVYARVVADQPVSDPMGFRSLLNSFLPRKRAISQMLIRDGDGRVLLCRLTYKQDWDLPGGVVEVGESPRDAVGREVDEELGLSIAARSLLLTDWLPAWGGWDDAVCLVFDGGVRSADIVEQIVREEREIRAVEFCTLDQVRERAAEFTARRIEAALSNVDRPGPGYAESGRR